jgi:hypothetical protein
VYRCELCTAVVGPGEPLRRHTVYREVPYLRAGEGRAGPIKSTRKEIAREIVVCASCAAALREGVSVQELSRPRPHAPLEAPRRPNQRVAELVPTVQDEAPTESLSDMIVRPKIRERADVVPPKKTARPEKVRESEQPPKKGKEQPRAMASTPKKPKTKKIPFDNQAVEVSAAVYEWTLGNRKWRFHAAGRGLNLGLVTADGKFQAMVHLKTLDQAAIFTEGFALGQMTETEDHSVEDGELDEAVDQREEDDEDEVDEDEE